MYFPDTFNNFLNTSDAPLSYMIYYTAQLHPSFPKVKGKQKVSPDQRMKKAENDKPLLINKWIGKGRSFELINVAI